MGCEGEQEESDHGDWRGGGERQAGLEEAWRLRNVSRDEREEPLTREVWKRVPHARGREKLRRAADACKKTRLNTAHCGHALRPSEEGVYLLLLPTRLVEGR